MSLADAQIARPRPPSDADMIVISSSEDEGEPEGNRQRAMEERNSHRTEPGLSAQQPPAQHPQNHVGPHLGQGQQYAPYDRAASHPTGTAAGVGRGQQTQPSLQQLLMGQRRGATSSGPQSTPAQGTHQATVRGHHGASLTAQSAPTRGRGEQQPTAQVQGRASPPGSIQQFIQRPVSAAPAGLPPPTQGGQHALVPHMSTNSGAQAQRHDNAQSSAPAHTQTLAGGIGLPMTAAPSSPLGGGSGGFLLGSLDPSGNNGDSGQAHSGEVGGGADAVSAQGGEGPANHGVCVCGCV